MDESQLHPPPLTEEKEQFKIPFPYVGWCHICEVGFMSLKEMGEHDKANLNKHQRINGERCQNFKK